MLLGIPYITFFDSGAQAEFWQILRAILFVGMPLFLIMAATELGGQFFTVIRNAFHRDTDENRDDYGDRARNERDYDI
ncbi:hypothetical protein D1872_174730 [compost metagenome]